MSVTEFLANFDETSFPDQYGRWLYNDHFYPPFTRAQLRDMRGKGVIQHDERQKRFRLTLSATHEKLAA